MKHHFQNIYILFGYFSGKIKRGNFAVSTEDHTHRRLLYYAFDVNPERGKLFSSERIGRHSSFGWARMHSTSFKFIQHFVITPEASLNFLPHYQMRHISAIQTISKWKCGE